MAGAKQQRSIKITEYLTEKVRLELYTTCTQVPSHYNKTVRPSPSVP